MKKQPSRKEVLRFIRVVRGSFPDSSLVYRYGGCYGFYQILKFTFPKSAKAYFDGKTRENHIITKIGDHFYDIAGIFDPEKDDTPHKLTKDDHEYWIDMASSQRIEYMIAKWRARCEEIAKS